MHLFENMDRYIYQKALLIISLSIIFSCKSGSNQPKVAISGFVSGPFSLRALELRVDSTFYFRKAAGFKDEEIYGLWYEDSVKIYFYDKESQSLLGEMNKKVNKINYTYKSGDSSLVDIKHMHIWIRYDAPIDKVDYKKMERLSG